MTEEVIGEETWLSQEAFDRLSKELETLQGPGRAEIAEKIDSAREEGDLKENGGYHAAREEQGKIEARIRQLEHLLRHATVGEASSDLSVASPGTVITATVAGREMRFLLGSREIAGANTDIDVFSEASPLGAAGGQRHEGRRFDVLRGAERQVDLCDGLDKVDAYRLEQFRSLEHVSRSRGSEHAGGPHGNTSVRASCMLSADSSSRAGDMLPLVSAAPIPVVGLAICNVLGNVPLIRVMPRTAVIGRSRFVRRRTSAGRSAPARRAMLPGGVGLGCRTVVGAGPRRASLRGLVRERGTG